MAHRAVARLRNDQLVRECFKGHRLHLLRDSAGGRTSTCKRGAPTSPRRCHPTAQPTGSARLAA
ncbi:Hypothetical protein AA314_08814 [Archangium gephyra]|uniref:Uncharacterized protein n=1 Tax=Archangium gephyra TaxID=48 RepID=A0AAC8QG94_9BACT|nr:Hypothetical protein AA314_08814 [Archangium gephyra]